MRIKPILHRKPIIHRDQVHGDVRYDPMSVALLNARVMQRLGRVYQLGYARLVFRGGTHTRLAHVMGAASMGMTLVDTLRFNYAQQRATYPRHVVTPDIFLPCAGVEGVSTDDRWDVLRHLVCWAALLHDLAHIPLGHTLEDEFEGLFEKHDDFGSPRSDYLWRVGSEVHDILLTDELLPQSFGRCGVSSLRVWQTLLLICFFKDKSQGFLAHLADEAKKANDDLAELASNSADSRKRANLERKSKFIPVIHNALTSKDRVFQPYMADIVGNTICADFLDYLRRDAINVGLDVLRDERVLSHFYVCAASNNEHRMALALVDRKDKPRLDVCTGVVELVRQRYRFAESIYYHKTKVAASAMFAKAMSMIEPLREIPTARTALYSMDIAKIASEVISQPTKIDELMSECMPSALLDAEVGDETLHHILLAKAFEQLKQLSTRKKDSEKHTKTVELLSAIALLQGVLHRRLYKIAMAIDCTQFATLTHGVAEGKPEKRLETALKTLRPNDKGGDGQRALLEREMAKAAGWPPDSILLYVPPRKSQAKGIETLAISGMSIVPLSEHVAVQAKVYELGRDYENLWRLIVLIHPDRVEDSTHLSDAIDLLVERLRAICGATLASEENGLGGSAVGAISASCRFLYVPKTLRRAGDRLKEMWNLSPLPQSQDEIDVMLNLNMATETVEGGYALDSDAYAERGYLVRRMMAIAVSQDHRTFGTEIINRIRQSFPRPGQLANYHPKEIDTHLYERSGMNNEELGRSKRVAELDQLAKALLSTSKSGQGALVFEKPLERGES